MKSRLAIVCVLLCSFVLVNAQGGKETSVSELFKVKKERYFRFLIHEKKEIQQLTKILSIDQVKGDTVWAYANLQQMEKFATQGYPYTLLTNPGDLIHPLMKDKVNLKERTEWNFYPTYSAYLNLMSQFQTTYPGLCRIDTIGTSITGRLLLAAKISDNVNDDEGEPEFLYTSSIHGDETTGYVLMLHLMDYLLLNYGSDPRITDMINNTEIWINPLANPDGTYAGGNNTVNGATRGNFNGIDMNRNYPDPQDGQHPDGNPWQPETVAFMNFAGEHHFVMAANFHGGAEVFNYPWDTWPRLHPDNNWWVYVGRQYVDTVHVHAGGGYMSDYDNGITNGYAWYEVNGGRQDYMNYFRHCREVTIELSNTKLLPASQLIAHWNYNYRSLLNYIDQSRYGIQGVITDSISGMPLQAKVFINNHDADSSQVWSSPLNGDYHRPVKNGTYSVTFSAPCYQSKTYTGVGVTDLNTTILNVQLNSFGGLHPEFSADKVAVTFGEQVHFSDLSCGNPVTWQWSFEGGNPATSTDPDPVVTWADAGTYDVSLTISDGTNNQTLLKTDYITVAQNILIANGTITTCTGNFYDSGGPSANYSNSENKVMVINPATPGAMLKITFSQFETESGYDFLYIYNGNSVSAPQVAGSPFNGGTSPGTIIASNATGALTFKFTSDGSVNKTGWAASLVCEGGTTGHTLSGLVTYPNPTGTPINNVTVKLKNTSGTVVATTVTDNAGAYSFAGVNDGNYTLEAITDKTWGGVSAADVLLFRKHIANISQLYGIFLACGDVNASGTLTASDVLLIKKRIVAVISSFPTGNWLFNNQPVTMSGNNVIQNFNGIIYGDANASYTVTAANNPAGTDNPASPLKSLPDGTLTLNLPVNAAEGKTAIPLEITAIPEVGAFQFSLSYDPLQMTFLEVTDWQPGLEEVMVAQPEPGVLAFIWAGDVAAVPLEGTLCRLLFEHHSDGIPALDWTQAPADGQWFDYNAMPLEVRMTKSIAAPEVSLPSASASDFRIYPNPGKGWFNLSLPVSKDTKIAVEVYNALGNRILSTVQTAAENHPTLSLDLTRSARGIYFVTISYDQERKTEKLVVN